MKTVLKVLGILLILAGIGAFLTASVGYSSAKQGPKNIAAPAGMTIEVPENDPERLKIEQKAENFLNASLGLGGAGLVLLIAGCVLPKKQQKYSESNQ